MGEKFIPCLLMPTEPCPPLCLNHKIAIEFRTYVEETLEVNLGRTPTEDEIKETWKTMTLSSRTPLGKGVLETSGGCKLYKDKKIVLTISS
ncbi:MAG: hypothetical protein NTV24_00510 [Candidatus Woesebacteria bacterium]|nr:hypothetical protein [Candidatus Woesebacteria bacterium]